MFNHSYSYWHVQLMKGDEVVNNIAWIVATDPELGQTFEQAMQKVIDTGMLPTNYTEQVSGGDGNKLLPGYSLDVEIIEWETANHDVARLF